MKCPKCHAPMHAVLHHGETVHRCDGCHGLWFAMDQLELLKTKPNRSLLDIGDAQLGEAFDEISEAHCPCCVNTTLTHRAVKGQEYMAVDHCPACGGDYLDAGEFLAYERPNVWQHVKAAYARLAA